MDVVQSGYERFTLRNPARWMKYIWLPFFIVFVAWIPLTWFYGNITSRTIGSAIFYFTVMIGGSAVMFVAYRRAAKAIDDPAKNFVEVRDDAMEFVLPGVRRTVIKYPDIETIAPTTPHFSGEKIILKLRRLNIGMMFSGFGGPLRIRLDLVEPERFLAAVAPHLT